ncbi:Cc50C22.6-like-2 protein [Microplitis demolitor]|nr:Cc50C22.6-like-2 protein [Microplitis demolitor]
MLSVKEFIENECLRDDNHKFMVLTDYFNNRTFHDNNNNNNNLSLSWIFVVYNEHDYTVLRYAYNLNVLKIENEELKGDTDNNNKDNNGNNNNKYIYFNPLKYVNDNIIFSLAPVIRNTEYTMIEKFLYPLHKIYVLIPSSSLLDNTLIINLMPLKPITNKEQADNDNNNETVYDINDDYTFIDHFKILLSNLIWFDIYIDMKLYQKCKRYIRNYSFYRKIDVIEV